MKTTERPLVASLVWSLPSQLHEVQAETIQHLGYPHHFFLYDEQVPEDAKIVLVQGPFGTLLPLVRQLERRASGMPILAYWFEESLELRCPEPVRGALSRAFSVLAQDSQEAGALGTALRRMHPGIIGSKGTRLGFFGDILWLHHHGLLDLLALSSTVYAALLGQYGVDALLVPRGSHPSYGRLLGLERDIALVWMGKTRTSRRKRAVYWLQEELAKRGQTMLIHDGEENPFIFGEERTHILNRARFCLSVFTHPADELSIRYYVAAANGAVVLTEPGENRYPFVPGMHLVECPIEEMPDTVEHYLQNPSEWESIYLEMRKLMEDELTLERSIAAILDRAERILWHRSNAWCGASSCALGGHAQCLSASCQIHGPLTDSALADRLSVHGRRSVEAQYDYREVCKPLGDICADKGVRK